MINGIAAEIGQRSHVRKLDHGPFPAAGFASYHRYRTDALKGKGVEYHEREYGCHGKHRIARKRIDLLLHTCAQ